MFVSHCLIKYLRTLACPLVLTAAASSQQFEFETDMMPSASRPTDELAAGDFDGDGDLDVIVGVGPSGARIGLFLRENLGDGVFDEQPLRGAPTSATIAESVAVADINGDGFDDVMFGYSGNGLPITVLAGNGNGTFSDITATVITTPNNFGVTAIELFDADGDGLPDAVFGRNVGGNLDGIELWLFQPALGRFVQSPPTAFVGPPLSMLRAHDICVADVDNDGDNDMAIAGGPSSGSSFWINSGTGVFTESLAAFGMGAAANSIMASVLIADLTGDGFCDVVFAPDAATVSYYFVGNGTGTGMIPHPQTPQVLLTTGQWTASLCAADLDADGDLDIVSTHRSDVPVCNGFPPPPLGAHVWINSGAGFFQPSLQLSPPLDQTRSSICADFDGDNDVDIMIGNPTTPDRLYLNRGNGTFGSGRISTPADHANATALASKDIDGDGYCDLAFGTRGLFCSGPFALQNRGDGHFDTSVALGLPPATPATPLPEVFDIGFGDFDGDGDPDAALATDNSSPTVVLRNVSTPGSIAMTLDATATPATTPTTLSLAIVDVDGACGPDIVLGNAGANEALLNNGTGAFPTSQPLPPSPNLAAVTTLAVLPLDVNRDNSIDLVMANGSGSGIGLGILENTPTGFVDATLTYVTTNLSVLDAALADFDNDGFKDIVTVADSGPNMVRVFLTRGAATAFAEPTSPVGPGQPSSIAVGDVDEDGNVDLVLSFDAGTFVGSQTLLYYGNGNGTFQSGVTIGSGTEQIRHKAAALLDLDGDGDLDYVQVVDVGGFGSQHRVAYNLQRQSLSRTAARLGKSLQVDSILRPGGSGPAAGSLAALCLSFGKTELPTPFGTQRLVNPLCLPPAVLSGGGVATTVLTVPSGPAWTGLDLHWQSALLSAGATPVVRLSNLMTTPTVTY